jgi:lysine 2,3-aminomutase
VNDALPQRVTKYYETLASSLDPLVDPIAAQFVPQATEQVHLPYETPDPLSDNRFMVSPRVVHRYSNRVLVLAQDECAVYCRHCFRRHFTGGRAGTISDTEIDQLCDYVDRHREVQEAVVSGGDPLYMETGRLLTLLTRLRSTRESLAVRVSSRIPVVSPDRITPQLVAALGKVAPLWLVLQCNHPTELSNPARVAISRFVDAGIPVINQAVLLRGVNDSVETLSLLFSELVKLRVKPYYLFQGDLAAGTRHFRTSIDKGLELMLGVRSQVSGLAMPTYAVDIPQGGGKTSLHVGSIVRREDDWYILMSDTGREFRYPREEEAD